jgi:hypothetical protein
MKKIVLLAIMALAMTAAAFAQNYTVQNVTGRVQQERGNNRVDVNAGDTLTAETIIHTGIGASLVLKEGDRTLIVPAASNGRVSELAASSGVRISGNIARTDTGAVSRTTVQASTASARASDAARDEDIAAE